ncbi:hypothetical protein DM619_25310 [Escherichia coli]|nr:hypothetical protein [Salmonella enterica subsp. enterica serovar London]EFN9356268.1 hypothetical protein [Escherichia coli]EFO3893014.1 hypothetical protein [Escherichia coli]PBR38302.1 hypothetical protein COD53_29655 [Escherichia coli]PZZ85171.1 hypothetical protein DIV07_07215 [Escherichia coli]
MLSLRYLKKRCRRGVVAALTPLCRGGTDYFYKKHHFISGVLLAARCVFLQDAPGGAARGVCSDM